jgi:hypothetical protein
MPILGGCPGGSRRRAIKRRQCSRSPPATRHDNASGFQLFRIDAEFAEETERRLRGSGSPSTEDRSKAGGGGDEHERSRLVHGGDRHEAAARVVSREVEPARGRLVVDLPHLAADAEPAAVGIDLAAPVIELVVPVSAEPTVLPPPPRPPCFL